MLQESFKHFGVAKGDLSQCCICSDAAPHAMRTHAVDVVHVHVTPLRSQTKPRLTGPMKTAVPDWAAHGVRSARIGRSLVQRLNLFEVSASRLSVVQRFVHHYVAKRLGGSNVLAAVRLKVKKLAFTDDVDGTTPFTFT
ncbi:hypothetical protein GQ600_18503 [Phytophthora cactorum]|nr:hypothetical protein GQ600_18503 [Phytophthora cactorum]